MISTMVAGLICSRVKYTHPDPPPHMSACFNHPRSTVICFLRILNVSSGSTDHIPVSESGFSSSLHHKKIG